MAVYYPQAGYYGFRCETQWGRRMQAFFPEFDAEAFRAGAESVQEEMERVGGYFQVPATGGKHLAKQLELFRQTTQAREGLFDFAAPGVLLAQTPEAGLTQLYDQFVLRHTARFEEPQEPAGTPV